MPEKPDLLMATNISSRSVFLVWVEPHDNNAPIQSYLIQYMQPTYVTGDRNRNVTTTTTEASITSLLPGATYSFTVTVINSFGMSPSSDPLIIRTLEEG